MNTIFKTKAEARRSLLRAGFVTSTNCEHVMVLPYSGTRAAILPAPGGFKIKFAYAK